MNKSQDHPQRLFVRRVSSASKIAGLLNISSTVQGPTRGNNDSGSPITRITEEELLAKVENSASVATPEQGELPEESITTPSDISDNNPLINELPITAAQKRSLEANGITTIKQLMDLIESGSDLVSLKEIGTKSAAKILEGLQEWQAEQKKTQL